VVINMDPVRELVELDRVDGQIRRCRELIAEQKRRIAILRTSNLHLPDSTRVLRNLQTSLLTLRRLRRFIRGQLIQTTMVRRTRRREG